MSDKYIAENERLRTEIQGYKQGATAEAHRCDELTDEASTLRAQVAELQGEVERLNPSTLAEAEQLVLGLATRFWAYGAMIDTCQRAWAKYLQGHYGIKTGAWDVTRDLALAKSEAQVKRLEREKAGAVELVKFAFLNGYCNGADSDETGRSAEESWATGTHETHKRLSTLDAKEPPSE